MRHAREQINQAILKAVRDGLAMTEPVLLTMSPQYETAIILEVKNSGWNAVSKEIQTYPVRKIEIIVDTIHALRSSG